MFFKRKRRIGVKEYCTMSLDSLFSSVSAYAEEPSSRNQRAPDPEIAKVHSDNMKAVVAEILLIAIAKNCPQTVSLDAGYAVEQYLRERGLSRIHDLVHDYSRAFGTFDPSMDGVEQMAALFMQKTSPESSVLASARQADLVRLFSQVLRSYFADVSSCKLVSE